VFAGLLFMGVWGVFSAPSCTAFCYFSCFAEKIYLATGVQVGWFVGKIAEVLNLGYRETPAVVHFRVQHKQKQSDFTQSKHVLLSKNNSSAVVKNNDLVLASEFWGIPVSDTDSGSDADEVSTVCHEEGM